MRVLAAVARLFAAIASITFRLAVAVIGLLLAAVIFFLVFAVVRVIFTSSWWLPS